MAIFIHFRCFFPFIPVAYSLILEVSLSQHILLWLNSICLLLDGQSSVSCQRLTICINIKSCYHIRWRDWTAAQSFGSWLAQWQYTVCFLIIQLQTDVKSANTLSVQLMCRETLKLQEWQLEVGTGGQEGKNILNYFTRSMFGMSIAWSLSEHWTSQRCNSNVKFIYTRSESVLWIQNLLLSHFLIYL